jgi:hypothetical protein
VMTPRSSCPGGESTPLQGANLRLNYEINNVTDTALGNLARGKPSFCRSDRCLSYRPPGSLLESRGGSILARAEDLDYLLSQQIDETMRSRLSLSILERKMDLSVRQVMSSPRSQGLYSDLLDRQVGKTSMRDYYREEAPALSVSHWSFDVRRRMLANLGLPFRH